MTDNVFEAKTIEAALEQAAAKLGASPADLRHEVLEGRTDDFWGLGDKVVVVRAWLEAEEVAPPPAAPVPSEAAPKAAPREEAPPAPAPPASTPAAPEAVETAPTPGFFDVPAATPASTQAAPVAATPASTPAPPAPLQETAEPEPEPAPEAPAAPPAQAAAALTDAPVPDAPAAGQEPLSDLPAAAVTLLNSIFRNMDFDCTAAARVDGDTLQVAITGEDNQYLLDGRGRGLAALELVLNHAFRHRAEGGHKKIRVDAGDFRSQRDDELRDLAFQVAHQAKDTNTEQQTRPLNPYERRIVHLTLAEDPGVSTRSLGTGFSKAVNVIPRSSGNR